MGYLYASAIERGAKHVLGLLQRERKLTYRRFYDGTNETAQQLEQAVVPEEARGWDSAELIIDVAVAQLEAQGLVETQTLDDDLADGEKNYSIAITAKGEKVLAGCLRMTFRDVDL